LGEGGNEKKKYSIRLRKKNRGGNPRVGSGARADQQARGKKDATITPDRMSDGEKDDQTY